MRESGNIEDRRNGAFLALSFYIFIHKYLEVEPTKIHFFLALSFFTCIFRGRTYTRMNFFLYIFLHTYIFRGRIFPSMHLRKITPGKNWPDRNRNRNTFGSGASLGKQMYFDKSFNTLSKKNWKRVKFCQYYFSNPLLFGFCLKFQSTFFVNIILRIFFFSRALLYQGIFLESESPRGLDVWVNIFSCFFLHILKNKWYFEYNPEVENISRFGVVYDHR